MQGDLVITFILFVVTGLPFVIIGYLIAIKKKSSLIAGWDESLFKNPESVSKTFGWSAMIIGVALGVIAYVFSAQAISMVIFIISVFAAVFVQILVAVYCNVKYGN